MSVWLYVCLSIHISANSKVKRKRLTVARVVRTRRSSGCNVGNAGSFILRRAAGVIWVDQIATTSDQNQKDIINQTIAEEQDAINQLERANEEIEQRMELRDRVKTNF